MWYDVIAKHKVRVRVFRVAHRKYYLLKSQYFVTHLNVLQALVKYAAHEGKSIAKPLQRFVEHDLLAHAHRSPWGGFRQMLSASDIAELFRLKKSFLTVCSSIAVCFCLFCLFACFFLLIL